MTAQVTTDQLRARFSRSLSQLYGTEVPAYTTLVEVSTQVNADVMAADPVAAERLGRIDRVTAERHGAIRVGTAEELRRVATIFAALGMSPVGFYDLRGSQHTSLPICATAFRPTSREALAINPFRVFTSCLVTDDRRYFDAGLQAELDDFLSRRTLFDDELIALAEHAERDGGLEDELAGEFLTRATACFELSSQPVDRAWYERLATISGVAADIGGVTSTHINHLTPRVLNIDDLYRRMTERGITMIDEIQGPPAWPGPDVLLRQTSFKALAEPRQFREPDGTLSAGSLSVRFGEVEQRGIALTRAGRVRYDRMMVAVDEAVAQGQPKAEAKLSIWQQHLPTTERELDRQGLGFFEYAVAEPRPSRDTPPAHLDDLLDGGWLVATPIVYEDFLPRSAAGIFASNLDDAGHSDVTATGSVRDEEWLEVALARTLADPFELYGAQRAASVAQAEHDLGQRIVHDLRN